MGLMSRFPRPSGKVELTDEEKAHMESDENWFTQEELDDEKHRIIVTPQDAETVFKKMVRDKRYQFDEFGEEATKMRVFAVCGQRGGGELLAGLCRCFHRAMGVRAVEHERIETR